MRSWAGRSRGLPASRPARRALHGIGHAYCRDQRDGPRFKEWSRRTAGVRWSPLLRDVRLGPSIAAARSRASSEATFPGSTRTHRPCPVLVVEGPKAYASQWS